MIDEGLEVRPVIDWNDGKAVESLLESLGLSNSDDTLGRYIGVDKTDEDAFKVVRDTNPSYGILVCTLHCSKRDQGIFLPQEPFRGTRIPSSLGEVKENDTTYQSLISKIFHLHFCLHSCFTQCGETIFSPSLQIRLNT